MSFWSQPYWVHLAIISVAFLVLERFRPWRRQKTLRAAFDTDLIYLAFNGHFLALLLAPAAALFVPSVDGFLAPYIGQAHVARWPFWAQTLVAFFAIDFVKWCVHVTLHRFRFLWRFHKVHHSIVEMDWAGNMRFHWFEIVVYDGVLHLPMFLLGFDWRVLLGMALFSTAMGHFNHANIKVSIGPLKYLFNHPGMHIWHHEYDMRYRFGCNFGINLSLWDWIFRTAYLPGEQHQQPERLGFHGIEDFQASFLSQQLIPLSSLLARRRG